MDTSNSTPFLKNLKGLGLMYIVLCISMIPLALDGYSSYLLILLIPYVFKSKINLCSILVICFSLSYTLSFFFRSEDLPLSNFFFYSLFPLIIFSCGSSIIQNKIADNTLIIIILSLVICLASTSIIPNIANFIQTGEVIAPTRIVNYSEESNLSATAYGLLLSLGIAGIGTAVLQTSNSFETKIKFWLILLGIISLFCCIHLTNRTGVVLGIFALLTGILLNSSNFKGFLLVLVILILLFLIYELFLSGASFYAEIVESYQKREENYTWDTGGDRFNRWDDALYQILIRPLGFSEYDDYIYAHNMWLDAGIRGGLISFGLLIVLTVLYIKYLIEFKKERYLSAFETNYIVILSIIMFSQAMVEPVIEGAYQFFLFFFFMLGILSSFHKRGSAIITTRIDQNT